MKKISYILASLLIIATAGVFSFNGQAKKVDAGMSSMSMVSPSDIVNGEITSAYKVTGNVTGEENKAVFGNSFEGDNDKLIIKSVVHNYKEYNVEGLFQGKATIDIVNLEENENSSISYLFGVKKLNGDIGIKNSVELRFGYGQRNDGSKGISFGIYEYVETGDTNEVKCNVLKEQRTVIGLNQGKPFVLNLDAKADGTLKIKLSEENGNVIKDYPVYNFETDGTGFMGFYGKGNKKVKVYDINMDAYSYEIAQNVDFVETFNHDGEDCYNKNNIYTKSKKGPAMPSCLSAQDGQLNFKNVTSAYLTTRYQYSNFEMEMDIPYFQRKAEYVEGFSPEGKSAEEIAQNVKTPITSWFGFAFGITSFNENVDLTPRYSKYLLFEGVPYGNDKKRWEEYSNPTYHLHLSYDSYYNIKSSSMKKNEKGEPGINLWDSKYENDTGITVKFSVIDGVVTLYAKLTGEKEYGAPQFQFDMGYTPTGYVRIFFCADDAVHSKGMGYTMCGNMSIDNLRITNKDMNKTSLPDYKFDKNTRPQTPDYVYKPQTDDNDMQHIFEETTDSQNGCKGQIESRNATIVLLFMTLSALFIVGGRKKS